MILLQMINPVPKLTLIEQVPVNCETKLKQHNKTKLGNSILSLFNRPGIEGVFVTITSICRFDEAYFTQAYPMQAHSMRLYRMHNRKHLCP